MFFFNVLPNKKLNEALEIHKPNFFIKDNTQRNCINMLIRTKQQQKKVITYHKTMPAGGNIYIWMHNTSQPFVTNHTNKHLMPNFS